MPGYEWFGDEERAEIQDVLDTGALGRYGFDNIRKDNKSKKFEEELCRQLNVGYAHLCSSGTAALSAALAACGIGAGDEVIIPPFTFVATMESVLFQGAIPVFAEIDDTLCLDPKAIDAVLTPRTKAVVPVHMCGAMAQIDELRAYCDQKGLILIEDACQSLGGTLKGKHLGTFGDVGCFSFDSVKTVTCGEGGGIITDDHQKYLLADQYADHGHDHSNPDRGKEGHPILGINYRISELNAAVGLAQLRKLPDIVARQREVHQIHQNAFQNIPEVTFRRVPDPTGDTCTFLSFFLPTEERAKEIVQKFQEIGLDSWAYWYPNNWHYYKQWNHLKTLSVPAPICAMAFKHCPDYSKLHMPVSDSYISRMISIAIRLTWSDDKLNDRVRKIQAVFSN